MKKDMKKEIYICDHCGTIIDNVRNEMLIVETSDLYVYPIMQKFKRDTQYHFCKKCYRKLMDFINKTRNKMK